MKLTFKSVMDSYKAILLANPGKALLISQDNAAFLSAKGEVMGAMVDSSFHPEEFYDFDESAFDDEIGAWDSDVIANETQRWIENPVLVDWLSAAQVAELLDQIAQNQTWHEVALKWAYAWAWDNYHTAPLLRYMKNQQNSTDHIALADCANDIRKAVEAGEA